jgi:WD40 repeat protein
MLLFLNGHASNVISLIVLQNGDLASVEWDGTIIIWNKTDGTLKRTLIGHTTTVFALTELQNGYVASGSGDYTIKIWNATDLFLCDQKEKL